MPDRHTLELTGYNALLADHCELSDQVAALVRQVQEQNRRILQLETDLRQHIAAAECAASDAHNSG